MLGAILHCWVSPAQHWVPRQSCGSLLVWSRLKKVDEAASSLPRLPLGWVTLKSQSLGTTKYQVCMQAQWRLMVRCAGMFSSHWWDVILTPRQVWWLHLSMLAWRQRALGFISCWVSFSTSQTKQDSSNILLFWSFSFILSVVLIILLLHVLKCNWIHCLLSYCQPSLTLTLF